MILGNRTYRAVAPAALSLVLLCGLAAETVVRPRPEEAEPYHAAVRAAAAESPLRIGPWIGTDQEQPPSAIQLLKPNVIISREYIHEQTGRAVSFILVHCKDARDIYGHYPPACYPAHGMKLRDRHPTPIDWDVAGTRVPGTEYRFDSARPDHPGLVVDNFIITPGAYCRDMQAVGDLVGDYTQRFFGAAQVQVVFGDPDRWSEAERREVFNTIVQAYLPLIEQIRKGNHP